MQCAVPDTDVRRLALQDTCSRTSRQRDGNNSYDITYTYDAVGNRLTKLDGGDTTTYTYDAANELLTETAPDSSVTTYTYDANGNQATKDVAGDATTYTWDGENRLTGIELPDGSVYTMTYDADGLRRKKQEPGETAVFVWDDQDVLLETDDGGDTQVTYTQTPDLYGLLVAQRCDTESRFYHFDAPGSVIALTDENEAETDAYRYYVFGEVLDAQASTINPFRFGGQLGYYDAADVGLQYLRARWYDAEAARFLSMDPEPGLSQGYSYCGNAPLSAVDPSGEIPKWVKVGCAGLAFGLIVHGAYHLIEWQAGRAEEERQARNWQRFWHGWRMALQGHPHQCARWCTQQGKLLGWTNQLIKDCIEGCYRHAPPDVDKGKVRPGDPIPPGPGPAPIPGQPPRRRPPGNVITVPVAPRRP